MRICFVANRLNRRAGGSDVSLDLMARSLVDRGHNVKVLTINTWESNEVRSEVPFEISDHSVGNNPSRIALARKIYRLLEENAAGTDCYHVFTPQFCSIAGLWRHLGGDVPIVGRLNNYTPFCTNTKLMDGTCHERCTIRDKFHHDPRSLGKRVARLPSHVSRSTLEPGLMNRIDLFFAISPAVRSVYEYNGLDTDRIKVVPNFYDPSFGGQVGEINHAETDPPRLLYVGRLVESKGADLLVKAAGQLDHAVHVDIVGQGPLEAHLRQLVRETGVADFVKLHGWVDRRQLPRYYAHADIFVHPCRWPEPFGRSLLEAMQYRCPLVVADVGGPPWVVGDAGVAVEPNDQAALASVIDELCNDPDRLATLRAATKDCLTRFGPNRVLDQIEAHYRVVTGQSEG